VVLKAREGQWGLGVVLVDGFDSLVSMVEFMMQKGEHSLVMQEFVEHDSVLRTETIGDTVVAGRRFKVSRDDFRSHNVAAVRNDAIEAEGVTDFPVNIVELSIKATHSAGVDFSGIDILEAKDGRLLVSEVNFPCMHAKTERLTGVPVSALMIDFLIKKSERMAQAKHVATPGR